MLKLWSCDSVKTFFVLWRIHSKLSACGTFTSSLTRLMIQIHTPAVHWQTEATEPQSIPHAPTCQNSVWVCSAFFSFFWGGGGVGGRLLLSVPTEWNRDDVSNSWMGGGREEKAAMQRGVFHSAWKPPSSWGWRGEEGRKGGGGRVIVTPWDSLYPPPTSLILSVTLPPLFLSLSTFSVCRLLFSPLLSSPLLSSPLLSSHTLLSLTSLTHSALSLSVYVAVVPLYLTEHVL